MAGPGSAHGGGGRRWGSLQGAREGLRSSMGGGVLHGGRTMLGGGRERNGRDSHGGGGRAGGGSG